MINREKRRVAYINEMIESRHAAELVAMGEKYHHDQLARIARKICSRPGSGVPDKHSDAGCRTAPRFSVSDNYNERVESLLNPFGVFYVFLCGLSTYLKMPPFFFDPLPVIRSSKCCSASF